MDPADEDERMLALISAHADSVALTKRHHHNEKRVLIGERDAAQRAAEGSASRIAHLEAELMRVHTAGRSAIRCEVEGCTAEIILVVIGEDAESARRLALVYACSSLAWVIGEETGRRVGVTPTAGQARDLCPYHSGAGR